MSTVIKMFISTFHYILAVWYFKWSLWHIKRGFKCRKTGEKYTKKHSDVWM